MFDMGFHFFCFQILQAIDCATIIEKEISKDTGFHSYGFYGKNNGMKP